MSSAEVACALSSLRTKQGIVKHSITRMVNTLKTIEATLDASGTTDQAKRFIVKAEGLDKEFRSVYYSVPHEESKKCVS